MKNLRNILKWTAIIIVAAFVLLVIARMPYVYKKEKTDEQVVKIHATKLTMDDVMGKNLPPDPGADADKTIAGIDANKNGIRDDVELAIFKEYPNSAKTRAVLLQYALALQMEVMQPIVNKEIVTEIVREQDRASSCVADALAPRKSLESTRDYNEVEKIFVFIGFVENHQLNIDIRKKARDTFLDNIGSYRSMKSICDIDYLTLSN